MNPLGSLLGQSLGIFGDMSAAQQQANMAARTAQAELLKDYGVFLNRDPRPGPPMFKTITARQCGGCGAHTTASACEYCGRPA